jgi:peroxiredoxin
MTWNKSSLAERIEETVGNFMSALPEDEARTVAGSFEKLYLSKIAEHAINVGDIAPDFALPNTAGDPVSLQETLRRGPVVLSFYRGGWCPFCNLELHALQARLPEIRALGAILIGISPETPDKAMAAIDEHQLEFEVLSDIGNKTPRRYSLLFTVYEEMRPLYLKWGLDVPASNGDDSWELPVPATYIIDRNGVVAAAHVDKDYTKRMEPDTVLATLQALKT